MTDGNVEKALLIAGRSDGPWCPVMDLQHVVVEGMNGEDIIEIESEERLLMRIIGDGVHSVNLAAGKVRVRRINGSESRITVRAIGRR